MKLLGLVLLIITGVSHTQADVLGTLLSQELFGTVELIREYKEHKENAFADFVGKDLRFTKEMIIDGIQALVESYGNLTDRRDDGPTDEEVKCIFQLAELGSGAQTNQLWALAFIDSFAKINSGYLRGNFRNFGHFSQCINIKAPMVDPTAGDFLYGRHCQVLLQQTVGDFEWPVQLITPPPVLDIGALIPPGLFLPWGMCFPADCPANIVDLIIRFIGIFLGVEPSPIFTLTSPLLCNDLITTVDLTILDVGALILVLGGVLLLIMSTVYEIVCRKIGTDPNGLTAAMSLYINGKSLFSVRTKPGHLQCLYGLRALALIWLMVGYRFLLPLALPLINPVDFFTDFIRSGFSVWILTYQFAIDVILMLNGCLITFLFFKRMDKNGRVSILRMYIHRYLRVTPLLFILIFFSLVGAQRLLFGGGTAPLFRPIMIASAPACIQYWWSAIAHVQNYVNPTSVCILHSWMFSVDMQLFWASPLLLFTLYWWGRSIAWVIPVLVIAVISYVTYIAFENGLVVFLLNIILSSTLNDYLKLVFMPTHARMHVWLIGVFTGYLCAKTREEKFRMHWFIETFLWIVSISGIVVVIVLHLPFQDILTPTGPFFNAFYIGFSRPIIALCLGWVIFGCFNGSGYVLDWFLSLGIWQPISRMGVSIYLMSLSAIVLDVASQVTPKVYSNSDLLRAFNGDFVVIFLFSTVSYLMVEAPIIRAHNFFYDVFKEKRDKTDPNYVKKKPSPWISFL